MRMIAAHKRAPEVVVITGASAGIGRAATRRFAEDGARIGLIARGRPGLEEAKREVEERGGEALVVPCDVADATAVEDAATAIEDAFGPIDVWVNNAMVTIYAEFGDIEPEEFERATHAVKGFTESVITELLHNGSHVHVGMVQLPGLNTPQFTWGRTKLPKQTQPV